MALGIWVSLIVASLLLAILILSLCARHIATRDLRVLSDLADKYGGTVTINSFNSSAILTFTHRGAAVRFYQSKGLGGKANRCCLRCELDYADPLTMHIGRGVSGDTSLGELRHLVQMPKTEVGSAGFRKEFSVRGNNRSFLNALVAADFETRLLSLRATDPVLYLVPKTDPIARIKGGSDCSHLLELSVADAPKRKEDFEKLIDDGLALLRRFFSASALPAGA